MITRPVVISSLCSTQALFKSLLMLIRYIGARPYLFAQDCHVSLKLLGNFPFMPFALLICVQSVYGRQVELLSIFDCSPIVANQSS
jgi:hypothetical protein